MLIFVGLVLLVSLLYVSFGNQYIFIPDVFVNSSGLIDMIIHREMEVLDAKRDTRK